MSLTINFYLNRDPKSSNKEKAIFCYIRDGKKLISLHTSERVEPKFWDVKRQVVKKSYNGSPELNEYLLSFKDKIKQIIRIAKTEDPFLTFEQIRNLILKEIKHSTNKSFFEVYNIFINTKSPQISKATVTKFKTIGKHVKNFTEINKINLTFENINFDFFDNFHNYLLSIGISNNTIIKDMQFLKSFLRWALERDYTKNNKFEKYQLPKTIETDQIALTMDDLKKIQICKLNSKLDKVRNLFLFQLYTGQRFSDIAKFSPEDIINDTWHLRQDKTKKVITVPIIEPAMKILERYKLKLPVISNQKFNEYIKEIGKIAKVNDIVKISKFKGAEKIEKLVPKFELISSHTARRTFVSLASYGGLNQQIVKSVTGHGTDKMLSKYFKNDVVESQRLIEKVFQN